MTNPLVQFKKDLETAIALRNAEVVAATFKALGTTHPKCDNCKFPEHAKEFFDVLSQYAYASMWHKRIVHNIYHDRHWFRHGWREEEKSADSLCYLRHKLDKIRPCADCIRIYNPTGKIKFAGINLFELGIRPKMPTHRVGKEIFDV